MSVERNQEVHGVRPFASRELAANWIVKRFEMIALDALMGDPPSYWIRETFVLK
jgi:hypothetical protein